MRSLTRALVVIALLTPVALAPETFGQSLRQRIERVRKEQRQEEAKRVMKERIAEAKIYEKLGYVVQNAQVDRASLRDTFKWWATNSTIPLVVDWNDLELEGIDPEQEITIELKAVPSGKLLALILKMVEGAAEFEMVYEVTPWYIEVMTKNMANKRTVVRVYNIADLIVEAPDFSRNVPRMDIAAALDQSVGNNSGSGGNRSGGGGAGGSGIFGNSNQNQEFNSGKSRADRAEDIAQLIRDTIEPTIWEANGGEYSSIKYLDGKLIIKAPLYVHRQIGPSPRATRPPARVTGKGQTGTGRAASTTGNREVDKERARQRAQRANERSKVSGVSSPAANPPEQSPVNFE